MSARTHKRRIGHLFEGRFYNLQFIWQSAEDRAWDNMAPVGREFGSPDYDRLSILDMYTQGDMSMQDAMRELGLDRKGLLDMVEAEGLSSLAVVSTEPE